MTKRPLKDIRPLGPLVDRDESEIDSLSETEKNIIRQAEEWHRQVSKEENKRKMMREYLRGITDDNFSNSEIDDMLDRAGL